MVNVNRKPRVQMIDGERVTRPRYMVNNQLKILRPVGIEITMVAIPKNALTLPPAPMVKKWCNQTIKDKIEITAVAHTSDV